MGKVKFYLCLLLVSAANCASIENNELPFENHETAIENKYVPTGSTDADTSMPLQFFDMAPENTPASSIMEFWKEQDKHFDLGTQKQVTLLLGSTGSGKSTTTLFLIGAELKSNETSENEFAIIDDGHRISRDSLISKTLIPDLMVDKAGNAYYDCPGFEDTRPPKYEITIAYFLNKLLTFANSLKLVFVVNYSAVKKNEDRNAFLKFLRNTILLLKDVDQFSDGIAMVVTKASTETIRKNGVSIELDDAAMIRKVAHFLREVNTTLSKENDNKDTLPDKRVFNEKAMKFVSTLLIQNGEKYERIGFFRKAEEAGPLKDMKIFQDEKKYLDKMINEDIKFVPKNNSNFGFAISAESSLHISTLIDDLIDNEILTDITSICDGIKKFYLQQEEQTNDIKALHDKFKIGHQTLSEVKADDTRQFIKQFINAVNSLEVGVSAVTLNRIAKHMEYVEFLLKVSEKTPSNSVKFVNQLTDTSNKLESSQKWYRFLMDLHKELSKSDSQNDDTKNAATKYQNTIVIRANEMKNVTDIGLEAFLKNTNLRSFGDVEKLQLNSHALEALKTVLTASFNNKIEKLCSSDNLNLTVTGYNVKISDAVSADCWSEAEIIEIFALNSVIIDEDIDRKGDGIRLLIVAPTWEVSGDRKIILDGYDGKSPSEKYARNGRGGHGSPGKGDDGKPGAPGGTAGTFMGVGNEFINSRLLKIYANGGTGGDGQHAGNGLYAIFFG